MDFVLGCTHSQRGRVRPAGPGRTPLHADGDIFKLSLIPSFPFKSGDGPRRTTLATHSWGGVQERSALKQRKGPPSAPSQHLERWGGTAIEQRHPREAPGSQMCTRLTGGPKMRAEEGLAFTSVKTFHR